MRWPCGAGEGQSAKARREPQAPGAGDSQGDPGGVFGARPSDVEEMMLTRLEEIRWSEEGLATFKFRPY